MIIDHSNSAIRCATHHAANAPAIKPSTAPKGPKSLLPSAPASVPTMKLTSVLSNLIHPPGYEVPSAAQRRDKDLPQDAQCEHRHERAEIESAERRHDAADRLDDPVREDVGGPHPP